MAALSPTVVRLIVAIAGARFHVLDERDLQEALAELFVAQGIEAERERAFGVDRPDFFCPAGAVAVEVKVKGSRAAVLRQLYRYAEQVEIAEVVLVTTRARHMTPFPETMAGKPVNVIKIGGLD